MKIATVLAVIGSCFISAHGDHEISLHETQLISEHTANITSYTLVQMENGCEPSLDCIHANRHRIEQCIDEVRRSHKCGVPKVRVTVKKMGVDFYRLPVRHIEANYLSLVAITPDIFNVFNSYKWRTKLVEVYYNFTIQAISHVSMMRVGGTTLETLTKAKMSRIEEIEDNEWQRLIKPITIQTQEANYLLMDWPILDFFVSLTPRYSVAAEFLMEPEIPSAEE